jgi:hypothetical protein
MQMDFQKDPSQCGLRNKTPQKQGAAQIRNLHPGLLSKRISFIQGKICKAGSASINPEGGE